MSLTFKQSVTVLSLGTIAVLSAILPAFANPYRDTDGTLFITGLSAQQEVLLTYPDTPKTSSARASACGAVTVRGTGGAPLTGIIKVDGISIDTSSLPQQLIPPCSNGAFSESRPSNFKTYDGQIVVVGKTANQFYTVETNEQATRRIRANACGFAVAKPNNRFTHSASSQIGINQAAPVTISSIAQKGAPICRSGTAYYPADWLSGS
jgi:hypothetical protein